MKAVFQFLFMTCLLMQAQGVFGQALPTPEFTYLVTQTSIDCATNQVCYRVAVQSNLDGPYYYDGATFRYFVDPTMYLQPVVGDHSTIPKDGMFNFFDVYSFTLEPTEFPIIGDELGFATDDTYWNKGSISAVNPSDPLLSRVEVGTTPVEIVEICLTAIEDLSANGAPQNLCYPFVFDESHFMPDNGILQGTQGLQSSYTEDPNTVLPGATYAAFDNAIQFIYDVNPAWNGETEMAGFGAIGTISSQNCLFNPCVTLPVELLAFEAQKQGETSLLQWSTANEINNSHFDVQRSADGRVFEKIGQVSAQKNSDDTKYYTFVDLKPLQGTNYYRLNQVDSDGQGQLSAVRTVDFAGNNTLFRAFPNPVTEKMIVDVRGISSERDGEILVTNSQGARMLQRQISGGQMHEINMNEMPSGTYILIATFDDTQYTQRVVKID